MAYLILNDEHAYPDERDDAEKFYEFDPGDKISVDRIHRILSLRKDGIIQNSESVLAGICDKSISPSPSVKVKTLTQRIFEKAKRFLRSSPDSKKKFLRKQSPGVSAYSCKNFLTPQSSLQ